MTEKTYRARDLGDLTGFRPATIAYYARIGLIPKPPFRGRNTVYTDEHLLYLEAINRLGGTHIRGLRQMKQLLSKASRERVEELAGRPKPPPATGKYRGRLAQAWHVVMLAPGVELCVSAAADAEAQRVADEIVTRYGR